MNHNLARLFYKSGDDHSIITKDNIKFIKELARFNSDKYDFNVYKNFFSINANEEFELTTTYPGLLLGAGYTHPALKDPNPNIKNDVGDFQLGFFFDHTTGLPVLPGSSVKGVLKSVFPKEKFSYGQEKLDYIKEKTIGVLRNKSVANPDVSYINENWDEIFFGSIKAKRKHIFHDAYISNVKLGCNLFEDDYITPHTKGPFKNPIPIRFLKIGPGVTFTFQFKLDDYKDNAGNVLLSKDNIKNVFKQILLDFGIGAKRNVGYGQFQ